MSAIIQALTMIAAVAVLVHSISCLNVMSRNTNHLIRLSHIMIATGAFAELYSVICGRTPSPEEAVFVIGIGLLSVSDRRKTFRCPLTKDALK